MWHSLILFFFFFNDTATTEIYTLSLHDALPIFGGASRSRRGEAAGHPRHDVHVHALELPPGGTDADAGQRADHRRDHSVAIRAGIGPLEPLQRAADVRARSLARAGRAHGPRVPR